MAVEAKQLTKSYGSARGIVDISLAISSGQIVGLVGANGAGKTTLMRTLLDFIRPTSGSLSAFGLDSVRDSVALRRRTAYLPGELTFPRRLNGHQVLDRYAFARPEHDGAKARELAERFSLDLGRKVGDLSKGNKQKVGLVLAFASGADLLVLDEPTSGLDPLMQREFHAVVRELAADGRTVLLSSHVMSEVEHLAASVALLQDGRLAAFDEVASITQRARRSGRIRVPPETTDRVAQRLREVDNVTDVTVDGQDVVTFAHTGSADPVIKALAAFTVDSLDLTEADLEDTFFAARPDGSTDDAGDKHEDTNGEPAR